MYNRVAASGAALSAMRKIALPEATAETTYSANATPSVRPATPMQPLLAMGVWAPPAHDSALSVQPVRARRPCAASHTKAEEAVEPKVKPADAPASELKTGVNTMVAVAVVGSAVGVDASATQPSEAPLSAHSRPKNTAVAVTAGGVRLNTADVTTVGLKRDSAPPAVHTTSPSVAPPVTGAPLGPDAEALVSRRPVAVRRANTRGTAVAGEVLSAPPAAPPSGAS